MNKRELFKLGAGIAAAMTMIGRAGELGPQPAPQAPNYPTINKLFPPTKALSGEQADPAYAIKLAMMQTAQEEADRQASFLRRAQQRLMRLRSTSEAWREAMYERYEREKRDIWTRLNEVQRFIFG